MKKRKIRFNAVEREGIAVDKLRSYTPPQNQRKQRKPAQSSFGRALGRGIRPSQRELDNELMHHLAYLNAAEHNAGCTK